MASEEHSFRIGKIAEEYPTPQIASISPRVTTGIRGPRGDRQGIRRINYDESSNLLYMVYIEETETSYVGLSDDNSDQEEKAYPRRSMKVILGINGTYMYESVQGVSDAEVFDYLSSQIDQELDVDEYGTVPRSVMLDFFNNKLDRVNKFKIDEIGEHEPNPGPIPGWIRDITSEFVDIIERQVNSVGRDKEADARENELAYGFAETSDPDMIRGVDEEGRTEELTSSGIYRLRYDSEAFTPEEEAELVTNKADRVFGEVFQDDGDRMSENSERRTDIADDFSEDTSEEDDYEEDTLDDERDDMLGSGEGM